LQRYNAALLTQEGSLLTCEVSLIPRKIRACPFGVPVARIDTVLGKRQQYFVG